MNPVLLLCAVGFLMLYVWVVWICFLRDSHREMILSQKRYLETLKDIQKADDIHYLMENGRNV